MHLKCFAEKSSYKRFLNYPIINGLISAIVGIKCNLAIIIIKLGLYLGAYLSTLGKL